MKRGLGISLLIVVLLAVLGCSDRSTKKANESSAKIIRAWNHYTTELGRRYERASMPELPDAPKMPQVLPEEMSEKIGQQTAKIAEQAGAAAAQSAAKEATRQVGDGVDEVKETAASATRTTRQAASRAGRAARHYARKLPRSQREANEMVVEKGRSWADSFNAWLRRVGANGGIFGRRSGAASHGKSRSPKSRLRVKDRL